MAISVALLSPPYSTLTYSAPAVLPGRTFVTGLRVFVPLGGTIRMGIVMDGDAPQPALGVALRPVLWPAERLPLCGGGYLETVLALSARQMCPPGQILGTVIPVGLRSMRVKLRVRRPGTRPSEFSLKALMAALDSDGAALASDWADGRADWVASQRDAAETEACVLLADPPWSVRPGAHRQIAVLEWVYAHPGRSRAELAEAVPSSSSAVSSLVRAGLIDVRPLDAADEVCTPALLRTLEPVSSPDAPLTPGQRDCAGRFAAAIASGRFSVRLLFGVTGSGKTRVYLEAAKACLKAGRSVLLLAPEVALALKLRRDVERECPGAAPILFHGYQSPSRRAGTFVGIAAEDGPKIVVGTRSALFLPFSELGLIVMDEEHDASFKQDEGLIYQAKEVAYILARRMGALMVLGSATPDFKTFYAAREGLTGLDVLESRVGGGTPPEIRLVDIRGLDPSGGLLAPETLRELRRCISDGRQAVILLNLRGYAPRMVCRGCGKVLRCPQCDIGLTYHKSRGKMVCHYCGHAVPFPCVCPDCGAMDYAPMGQGTERMEEYLSKELPEGAGVLRLDSDSTRREGTMESILRSFARMEASVLVGTQMLSKGHHFPNVTLAIVADGDIGLNTPDYRASERTFQLLVQSAGRAGRGPAPGTVIVQTRDPGNCCWRFVRTADYEGFYRQEMERRRKRRYPPFIRLALIRLSHPAGWEGGGREMARLAAVIRQSGVRHAVTVLGPAPAMHELLRGRRRLTCLLKAEDWASIRAVYADLAAAGPSPDVRMSLDLDPMDMD